MDGIVTNFNKPKQRSDFSCNWKALSKTLISEPPAKTYNKISINKFKIIIKEDLPISIISDRPQLTKCLAMDCEFVGVGFNKQDNHLAKVSVVNQFGECVYDEYVKPREKITDYRKRITGISPVDLINGKDFKTVQNEIADLFNNRILVGHAIKNDLHVLYLNHPQKHIRDTSRHKYFCQMAQTKYPSLRKLAKIFLDVNIQNGIHDSIEDARTTMALYMLRRKEWEKDLKSKRNIKSKA